MTRLRYSSQSIRDVQQILKSVERDRPRAAVELVERLLATCERLAKNPTMGTSRNDLRSGLRAMLFQFTASSTERETTKSFSANVKAIRL